MFDKLELRHVGFAVMVGALAGILVIALDRYVVGPLEAKVGITPGMF
jgi:hypothetical protein